MRPNTPKTEQTNNQEVFYEFYTEYVSKGKRYGETILAKTWLEAEFLLRDKKLTERITGYDPEKPLIFD